MPPEPSQSKVKRRSSRKEVEESLGFDGSHAREMELKRNRGEISCAECRRLKIKCDKQIPCQSCQRRGCAALCPNGSLATGQGTRFVLAATEHLHRRISKMRERIRQLEDALAAVQAKQSNEPHPLLREELLSSRAYGDDDTLDDDDPPPVNSAEVANAFGTLSISEHGISRFFGPSGGLESLLTSDSTTSQRSSMGSQTPETPRDSRSPGLPGEVNFFSQSFPFTPLGPVFAVQRLIESHLPSWERAQRLAEKYLAHAAWLFRSVSRSQLMDEMLPVIYKSDSSPPLEDYSGPHDVALLFIIFALGAFMEVTEESNTAAEAEHYHQIARAAICLQPILEKPSMVTIQTLQLLSVYNAMSGNEGSGNETSMESTWSLVTLAAHLSQTIGLHRDSARWKLSSKMVQRRRVLFWDIFTADIWQSLNTGRPPSFSLAYVDCRLPTMSEDDVLCSPDEEPGFETWNFRFASECVAEVAARTLTAESPSHATIMELDRKVREFPMPTEAPSGASTSGKSLEHIPNVALSMQYCVLAHMKEVVLLYIHRSFFAQAIIEHPSNPLRSSYAPSFLAAYRSSSTILKSVREQFALHPVLCSRFWTMWSFAFSAAIVFGTVITRGPRSPLASSAMVELDQACLLFSKASAYSKRAAKALLILKKLSEKARYALSTATNEESSGSSTNSSCGNMESEDDNDELSIFAGRTRFVSSTKFSTLTSSYQSLEPLSKRSSTPPHLLSASGPYPGPSSTPTPASFPTDNVASASTSVDHWIPEPHAPNFMAVPSQASNASYSHDPRYQLEAQHGHPDVSTSYSYSWQHGHGADAQYHGGNLPTVHYGIPPSSSSRYQDDTSSNRQVYNTTPFQPIASRQSASYLADLGLASRDSRLDERWTTFMHDSGLLEDMEHRNR